MWGRWAPRGKGASAVAAAAAAAAHASPVLFIISSTLLLRSVSRRIQAPTAGAMNGGNAGASETAPAAFDARELGALVDADDADAADADTLA